MEFAHANTNAAFDFVQELARSEVPIRLHGTRDRAMHAPNHSSDRVKTTKELAALAQKVALSDSTEPLKAGVAKAFNQSRAELGCPVRSCSIRARLEPHCSGMRWRERTVSLCQGRVPCNLCVALVRGGLGLCTSIAKLSPPASWKCGLCKQHRSLYPDLVDVSYTCDECGRGTKRTLKENLKS